MGVLQSAGFVFGGVSKPARRSRQVSKKARTNAGLSVYCQSNET